MARPRRPWLKFWAADARADHAWQQLTGYEQILLLQCWAFARDAPIYGHLLDKNGAPISTEQVASAARTCDRRWREHARAAAHSYLRLGLAEEGEHGALYFPQLRSRQEGDDTAAERMRRMRQRRRYGTVTAKPEPLAVTEPLPVTVPEREGEGENPTVYTEGFGPGRAHAHATPTASQGRVLDQDSNPSTPGIDRLLEAIHDPTERTRLATMLQTDFAGLSQAAYEAAREAAGDPSARDQVAVAVTQLAHVRRHGTIMLPAPNPNGNPTTTEEEPPMAKASDPRYIEIRAQQVGDMYLQEFDDHRRRQHSSFTPDEMATKTATEFLDDTGADAKFHQRIIDLGLADGRARAQRLPPLPPPDADDPPTEFTGV